MNAERYRSKAQHYLLCARQMTDPNAKAALLDVATHWIQMARQWEDESERVIQKQRQAQPQEGVLGGKSKILPE